MSYQVRRIGHHAVVSLTGSVDLNRSPDMRAVIEESLIAGRHVVVDMASVSYIDSSGVAGLVEGLRLARSRGLEFSLAAVSERALEVLELAHLHTLFAMHATVEAALPSGYPAQRA